MSCLVEVHNQAELDTVLTLDAAIIGINNRNLYTFETTLDITAKLAPMVPQGKVLVSESGIHDAADIKFLQQYNVNAVLIGELLMRSQLPGKKLKEMVGVGDVAN
jgi:indole-3-glycerol phosphate synthase